MPAPEIDLTLGATSYGDGVTYEFGSVRWGANTLASTVRGFIVHNTGTATLTLSGPSLSGGLGLYQPFTATSIAPGGSEILMLQVNAGVPGDYTGHVIFDTNDTDENPYDLFVHWVVTAADLTASAVTVADLTPDPGQAVSISYRVDNIGTGANYDINSSNSFPINTGIYLSTDSTITAGDIQIGSYTIPALGPQTFSSHTEMVTIPGWVTPGATYYIGAIADYNGMVLESDNGNNASAGVAITIPGPTASPDLVARNLETGSTTFHPGDVASVTYSVQNIGAGPAAASNAWIGMYNDAGTYWDFETRAISALGSDGVAAVTTSFTLPSNLAPGIYHLAAIADSTSDLAESNEGNNWSNIVDLTVIANPIVTNYYDANGHRTMQYIVYGDGTSIRFGYDAQDRTDWMQEYRADGTLQYYTDWDQALNQTWSQTVEYYAANGTTRTQKLTNYDNGTSIRVGYDAAGNPDWQQEMRANGTLEIYTDWDQAGNQTWTQTVEYYAADGATRTQKNTTYDNGTSIRVGYDVHGHADWQEERRADATLQYYTDWDQDAQVNWSYFIRYYGADGTTVTGTHIFYDNGTDVWI